MIKHEYEIRLDIYALSTVPFINGPKLEKVLYLLLKNYYYFLNGGPLFAGIQASTNLGERILTAPMRWFQRGNRWVGPPSTLLGTSNYLTVTTLFSLITNKEEKILETQNLSFVWFGLLLEFVSTNNQTMTVEVKVEETQMGGDEVAVVIPTKEEEPKTVEKC